MSVPQVSIGIPLHRSAQWFEVIAGNIETVDYPDLEIIVSDRHMADDTLDRLSDRFAADSRVRFLRARDGINWVAHYNLLLREARGRYFCWMPHDDTFPADWISALVACLERDPDIVLACGRIKPLVLHDGAFEPGVHSLSPPDTTPPGSVSGVLSLLRTRWLGVCMRGVFRRDEIVERELWIEYPRGGVFADIYWIFALALIGRLRAVEEVECLKRYYPESTQQRWRATAGHVCSAFLIVARYVYRIHGPGRQAAIALWAAALWTSNRLWQRLPAKPRRVCGLAFKFVRRPVRGVRRMREMGLKQVLSRLRGNAKVNVIKPSRSRDP